jgi:hypothetical protein
MVREYVDASIAALSPCTQHYEWRYDFTKQPVAIYPALCAARKRGAGVTNEIAAEDCEAFLRNGGLSDMIF